MFFKVVMIFCSLAILSVSTVDTAHIKGGSTITDSIEAITAELWRKIARTNLVVSSYDIDLFFSRYQEEPTPILEVVEYDFLHGTHNWSNDFLEFAIGELWSKGYFRSLDVYFQSASSPRLSLEDMDEFLIICEEHSGIPGIGIISESQFKSGFEEVIFRSLPFSLLFAQYLGVFKGDPLDLEEMSSAEFNFLFRVIDRNENGIINLNEFEKFWFDDGYGPIHDAAILFNKLNYQGNGQITWVDWSLLFNELDCRVGGNDMLDHPEFLQLDLIMHGLRSYPLGPCLLERRL